MNQNHNTHKGIHDLKKVSLSHQEKGTMLSNLMSYIEHNPMSNKHIPSPWYTAFFSHTQYQTAYVYVCLVGLLIVGGNVSYAAEQSLPGDLLYPVKLRVNEKIQDVLKFSPKAKVVWEETKVEKRLQEAEILIIKGTFDEPKRVQIEKEVEKNVENLSKQNRQDSERVRATYMLFKSRHENRNATSTDKDKNGIELPRIVISTSTLKSIQNTKLKRIPTDRTVHGTASASTSLGVSASRATSSDIVVQVKIENEDKVWDATKIDKKEEVQKEVEKFTEKIQETLKDSLKDTLKGGVNIFKR